jgi:AMMECR1 domain-containing protein
MFHVKKCFGIVNYSEGTPLWVKIIKASSREEAYSKFEELAEIFTKENLRFLEPQSVKYYKGLRGCFGFYKKLLKLEKEVM